MLKPNKKVSEKRLNFSSLDIQAMNSLGVTKDAVLNQIELFREGMHYAKLNHPCTVGDGIIRFDVKEQKRLEQSYESAMRSGRVIKFVPASGAATRMFEALYAIDRSYSQIDLRRIKKVAETESVHQQFLLFIQELRKFPFYEDLRKVVLKKERATPEELVAQGKIKEIIQYLLAVDGLNYSDFPKGLIPFHRYGSNYRTAFEEHLVEALGYIRDSKKRIRIHFTLSPEHQLKFKRLSKDLKSRKVFKNCFFDISFSCQDASTNTIAVDHDNFPFRDQNGKLIFRPGGHGALIYNLNRLKGDIVFIKNIDNVVPDRLKEETFRWKRILGGCLVEVQNQIFSFMERLNSSSLPAYQLDEMLNFAEQKLNCTIRSRAKLTEQQKKQVLLCVFDRPIRVCGMVKNQGEPGGGPFWVEDQDGGFSLQVIEFSQINKDSQEQMKIWESSTHFNPVDIVCGLRNWKGKPYDLTDFIDSKMAFISIKSREGRELKALEHPGLWNGAMAKWNTLFVEVPVSTFNPVKTVFDLLRSEHQSN